MSKPFTVTKSQARELKRISQRMKRQGGGVSIDVIRQDWLDDMAAELRRMAKAYLRTHRGGAELLDALGVAKVEGVDPAVLTEIIDLIGSKQRKRRAA